MPLLPITAGGPGDQFDGSSTTDQRNHPLGSSMYFADGRRFRYGQATATAIATARLCQQTLNDANWDELVVPTARAIGDKQITVTNGTAVITVDLFKDGYLNVEDDTGEGYLYTIEGNSAAANGAACTVDIRDKSGLQVAWTVSTTVNLFANPYGRIIIHPSPATALLVGVTPRVIAASRYGWFQTWGPASVLVEGTHVINECVIDSATADGAVAPTASTAAGEENYVGVVCEVAATTEQGVVYLRIS